MDQNFIMFLSSDVFLSAEGGWTDSDLPDLVTREIDINPSTEKFLAVAKLRACFHACVVFLCVA